MIFRVAQNKDHSPNTIRSYELDLNQFLTWFENIIPQACMADIGTLTLQQYRNKLERHGNQKKQIKDFLPQL